MNEFNYMWQARQIPPDQHRHAFFEIYTPTETLVRRTAILFVTSALITVFFLFSNLLTQTNQPFHLTMCIIVLVSKLIFGLIAGGTVYYKYKLVSKVLFKILFAVSMIISLLYLISTASRIRELQEGGDSEMCLLKICLQWWIRWIASIVVESASFVLFNIHIYLYVTSEEKVFKEL